MKLVLKTTGNNASETLKEVPMEPAKEVRKRKQITAEEIQQALNRKGWRMKVLSPTVLADDQGFIKIHHKKNGAIRSINIYMHIEWMPFTSMFIVGLSKVEAPISKGLIFTDLPVLWGPLSPKFRGPLFVET